MSARIDSLHPLHADAPHRLQRPSNRRPRFLLAAVLVAAMGCTDSPVSLPFFGDEPQEPMESVPGILVAPNLLESGDALIPLIGWQTVLFEKLIGAEILVEGTIDELDGALFIREFMVLAVDGMPVLDGILYEEEGGYYVLTTFETRNLPGDVPFELTQHLGRRVWISIWDGHCVDYGVLEL